MGGGFDGEGGGGFVGRWGELVVGGGLLCSDDDVFFNGDDGGLFDILGDFCFDWNLAAFNTLNQLGSTVSDFPFLLHPYILLFPLLINLHLLLVLNRQRIPIVRPEREEGQDEHDENV